MAAHALYGHGTRWRRPLEEEAGDGGAQMRWRPGPPPRLPWCLRREAGRALPESRGWFRLPADPALCGSPALSASLGVLAGRWARALAELSGLGRPRGWSGAASLALLGFPTSSSALKRGKKQL